MEQLATLARVQAPAAEILREQEAIATIARQLEGPQPESMGLTSQAAAGAQHNQLIVLQQDTVTTIARQPRADTAVGGRISTVATAVATAAAAAAGFVASGVAIISTVNTGATLMNVGVTSVKTGAMIAAGANPAAIGGYVAYKASLELPGLRSSMQRLSIFA